MEEITLKQVYEKVVELDVRMTLSSERHNNAFKELRLTVWWILFILFGNIMIGALNLYIHLMNYAK